MIQASIANGDRRVFEACMRNQAQGPVITEPKRAGSDVPSYSPSAQRSTPALPDVYRSLMQLCKEHYSPEQRMNFAYRIQTARQLDAYPEYDVAFAGIPIIPELQGGHSHGFTTGTAAASYADCIADARGELGDYYFFGRGVAQDYATAAHWYEKSLNTRIPSRGWIDLPAAMANAAWRHLCIRTRCTERSTASTTALEWRSRLVASPPQRVCPHAAHGQQRAAKDHGRLG